jgi:hypothetical protein
MNVHNHMHVEKGNKVDQYGTGVRTVGGLDFMSSMIRFKRACVIWPSLPTENAEPNQ